MQPEDVPTILEILDDYGITSMLEGYELQDLIDDLSAREDILRTDAIGYAVGRTYKTI